MKKILTKKSFSQNIVISFVVSKWNKMIVNHNGYNSLPFYFSHWITIFMEAFMQNL